MIFLTLIVKTGQRRGFPNLNVRCWLCKFKGKSLAFLKGIYSPSLRISLPSKCSLLSVYTFIYIGLCLSISFSIVELMPLDFSSDAEVAPHWERWIFPICSSPGIYVLCMYLSFISWNKILPFLKYHFFGVGGGGISLKLEWIHVFVRRY